MNFNDLFQYKDLDMFYCDIDTERERGLLINEDCMKVLKQLDDNSVDLTLTDIPYGEVNRASSGLRNFDKGDADIVTFELEPFIEEIYRITKGTIIIFCGQEQFSFIRNWFTNRQNINKDKIMVRQLVWKKSNPSPVNGQYSYLSGLENAVWCKKKGATFNAHCKSNVFEFPCGRSKLHPTTKNFDLLKDLILDNSNEGDIILDPCAGSCSTLSVAKSLNRRFIGIELNEEYFKIGSKVIEKGYDNVWKEMKNQ